MDKTLLKVGGVVAIIIGVCYSITIFGLIIGIPMIIGGVAFTGYAKLKDEEVMFAKGSILGWSIFFLLFAGIPGILGIIFYLSMTGALNTNTQTKHYTDELKDLKALLDSKTITQEEFEKRKTQILSK